jgi:flagellar protein FliS
MWRSAQDAYLESKVLSADPVELIGLLYQTGMGAVQEARGHLADGKILERSKAITRAGKVLIQLTSALDHERGGEISRRLGALYGYMLGRLGEANLRQRDEPMAEVLSLLATLAEGWEGVRPAAKAAPEPAADRWNPAATSEPSPDYADHAWSF